MRIVLLLLTASLASWAKEPKKSNVPQFQGTEQLSLVGAQCTIEVTTTYKGGSKSKEEYPVKAASKDDCSASAAPYKEIAFPDEVANKNVVPRWKER